MRRARAMAAQRIPKKQSTEMTKRICIKREDNKAPGFVQDIRGEQVSALWLDSCRYDLGTYGGVGGFPLDLRWRESMYWGGVRLQYSSDEGCGRALAEADA